MVFVTIGSSHFGFKRLIAEVDRLAGAGILSDVVAQIGNTDYEPGSCVWKRFLMPADVQMKMQQADFVICHAGCATMEEGFRFRKKMIVMPRRVGYKEAPDDHQLEIVRLLLESNRILVAYEAEQLAACIRQVRTWVPPSSSPRLGNSVVEYIAQFITQKLA